MRTLFSIIVDRLLGREETAFVASPVVAGRNSCGHFGLKLESMEECGEQGAAALRVLLVDDDVKLVALLRDYLHHENMDVEVMHEGAGAVTCARDGAFDIVVLDVMLPGLGGFDVLRRMREQGGAAAQVPVLMLSARGDEIDRVLGLELGADDYLSKPFSSRELVARMRAILRRAGVHAPENAGAGRSAKRVQVGDIELDCEAREVRRAGEIMVLTSGEFDLLEVLLRSAGETVTREAISRTALGRELTPFDRSIDVHIHNLRRKLGRDPGGSERIKAIRGVGYLYARPKILR